MSSLPGLYGVTLATNILSYSVVLAPGMYGFDGAAAAVGVHCAALASAAPPASRKKVRRSMVPVRSSAES